MREQWNVGARTAQDKTTGKTMTRKSITGLTALALALCAGFVDLSCSSRDTSAHVSGDDPPNVVLIIIDALRADLLGCYGFPRKISPELDDIAEGGVLFETTISQCSWTRPSIASMLTSLYPRTLGMYKEQFDILADRFLTLSEILKENGYNTVGITANPHLNKAFNFHQGFDRYFETAMTWGEMRKQEERRARKRGLAKQLPTSLEAYDRILDTARDIGEGPTYVQINVMEVHSPALVRYEYKYIFDSYEVRLREGYSQKQKARLKHLVRRTYAGVGQISHDTAEFMNKLTSLPGWENTLFVITSDHGQGLVDHPDVAQSTLHGNLLYESQVVVPLILYNPADSVRVCGGRRVKAKVRLLDILPTVLDYVGIAPSESIQGKSLLPLATGVGEPPNLPGVFVTETNWREVDKIAAYDDEWRYIENRDGWEGVNSLELQRTGIVENGKFTGQVEVYGDEAERLSDFLLWWEERHPRAESTQPPEDPSEEELDQLRSLGYVK